jgi:hypothetical protein
MKTVADFDLCFGLEGGDFTESSAHQKPSGIYKIFHQVRNESSKNQ